MIQLIFKVLVLSEMIKAQKIQFREKILANWVILSLEGTVYPIKIRRT
jgi:hypothetical protein